MILTETIYINSEPIGVIRQDTNTRQFAFSSTESRSRLPEKEWQTIDELKTAVRKTYQQEQKR